MIYLHRVLAGLAIFFTLAFLESVALEAFIDGPMKRRFWRIKSGQR